MRNYYWLIAVTTVLMAVTVYAQGNNASKGFDIEPNSERNMKVEAQCWINDGANLDDGKADGGKLIGTSSVELREKCAQFAKSRYGEMASSTLKNIRLTRLNRGELLHAKCTNARLLTTATLTSVKRMLVWWMEKTVWNCDENAE